MASGTRGPRSVVVLVVLLVCLPVASQDESRGGRPEYSPARVNRAIDAGVEWLKKAQRKDGSWGPCTATGKYGDPTNRDRSDCYFSGPTSFSLFVLATCDVPRRDRCIKRGLNWLREYDRDDVRFTSYESSSLVLMLVALYGPEDPAAEPLQPSRNYHSKPRKSRFDSRDWRWMLRHLENIIDSRNSKGGFGYWSGSSNYADVSATQFAALALREARRAGCPLEQMAGHDLWERLAEYLRDLQRPTGEFPYHAGEAWSAGRTAAGLSTLLICREQIGLQGRAAPGWLDRAIDTAFEALGRMHSPVHNQANLPDGFRYHYCHLYAVERVGSIAGRRELGGKDWYRRGAEVLCFQQRDAGDWQDRTCMDPEDTLGTCFALLFLKRATPPSAVTIPGRQ